MAGEEGVERRSLLVAAPYTNCYTANSCSDFPCICFTNALFVSQPLLSDGCVYIIWYEKKKAKKKELERNATITLNSSSASFELSTSLKKVSLLMKCFGAGIIYFLKENMRKLFSLHTVCKCCHHFSAHKQMLPTERQKYTQGQIFPCKEGEDVEKLAWE